MRAERDGEKIEKGVRVREAERNRDTCTLSKLREGGRNVHTIGATESLLCVGLVCWVVHF